MNVTVSSFANASVSPNVDRTVSPTGNPVVEAILGNFTLLLRMSYDEEGLIHDAQHLGQSIYQDCVMETFQRNPRRVSSQFLSRSCFFAITSFST